MSDYPSVRQVIGSGETPDAGIEVTKAVSGKPRIRSQYSQTWRTFNVVHDQITASQKSSIMSHFEANKFDAFNFTWQADSQTYLVRYASTPIPKPIEGDFEWNVQVLLIEVPA